MHVSPGGHRTATNIAWRRTSPGGHRLAMNTARRRFRGIAPGTDADISLRFRVGIDTGNVDGTLPTHDAWLS